MGGLDLFSASDTPEQGALSVTQVTRRARQLIDAGFDRLWVRGEVANFKAYRSGHWYFSLRDRESQVRCVMWRDDARRVRTLPEDGLELFADVHPTIWEERGEFRLTVRRLLPGRDDGQWQREVDAARDALQRDGLLDPARKRGLPPFPARIAVITSPDGAALQDIMSVVRRRWPAVELLVLPARVQGDTAERELVAALTLVNRVTADVVILGRGGGSREDLWPFNREAVARALAGVRVPTVSAVGHETDVSLTDLVADLRAPTPSAAAEAVVPDRAAVTGAVDGLARRLGRGLTGRVRMGWERLGRTGDRLHGAMTGRLTRAEARLERAGAALDALSPLRVLDRGFAVPRGEDGTVLRTTADFPAGRRFRLTVRDGDVSATVLDDRHG